MRGRNTVSHAAAVTEEATRAPAGAGDDACRLVTCRGTGLVDTDAPSRVVLVPWGEVESTAGSFVVDEESGRLAVEAFAAHGADLPIDFEHQTLGGSFAAPSGRAPAAGWVTALEASSEEGIAARVNWTAEGARLIGTRAYRYLSPVALIRRRDRKLVALHSAALTNKPAIVGMAALVNRSGSPEEEDSQAVLCRMLSLSEDAVVGDVLDAAVCRIRALEDQDRQRDAADRVEAAMSAGKLTEAQRSWALSLAMDDSERFEQWLRTAPVVVALGRSSGPSVQALSEAGVSRRARSEHRSSRLLQQLTSEEAYVAQAVQASGVRGQ